VDGADGPAGLPGRPLDGLLRSPGGHPAALRPVRRGGAVRLDRARRARARDGRGRDGLRRRTGGSGGVQRRVEHRTGYEWLSRDEAEVDRYVADPLAGFDLPDDAVPALFGVAPQLADPELLAAIRPDLPLPLVSGSDDPLAGGGALVELLGDRYHQAGITDVTTTLYQGARHEIFNETNRDEITADVVAWLQAHG